MLKQQYLIFDLCFNITVLQSSSYYWCHVYITSGMLIHKPIQPAQSSVKKLISIFMLQFHVKNSCQKLMSKYLDETLSQ